MPLDAAYWLNKAPETEYPTEECLDTCFILKVPHDTKLPGKYSATFLMNVRRDLEKISLAYKPHGDGTDYFVMSNGAREHVHYKIFRRAFPEIVLVAKID